MMSVRKIFYSIGVLLLIMGLGNGLGLGTTDNALEQESIAEVGKSGEEEKCRGKKL